MPLDKKRFSHPIDLPSDTEKQEALHREKEIKGNAASDNNKKHRSSYHRIMPIIIDPESSPELSEDENDNVVMPDQRPDESNLRVANEDSGYDSDIDETISAGHVTKYSRRP